jgi:hypothetical protein
MAARQARSTTAKKLYEAAGAPGDYKEWLRQQALTKARAGRERKLRERYGEAFEAAGGEDFGGFMRGRAKEAARARAKAYREKNKDRLNENARLRREARKLEAALVA